ncbi:phosphoglycerate mutase-like protein [Lactarius psammicola]|nr:phosphoglycerate mutase-like protein [Lactarius psammicola]
MTLSAPPLSIPTGTGTPWDIATYCNASHVVASHYKESKEGAKLVHVGVMIRHHKRAPAFLVPNEREINVDLGWDCSGVKQFTYNGSGAPLYHSVTTPPEHPFADQIWAGNCEEGQLTAGGFHDSKTHGRSSIIWVYHTRLGFLSPIEPSEISVFVSAVLVGMNPSITNTNSLISNYKRPRADALLAEAQAAPFWQDISQKNLASKEGLDDVLGQRILRAPFISYQDVLTSRTWNDHPLHCNAARDCVSEEDAAEVFALGNLEFDHRWHPTNSASEYNRLFFWQSMLFSELADTLESPKYRLALYAAHNVSAVRLAANLKIFPLRWPRLGCEIVEIWKVKNNRRFVRVLYDGELADSFPMSPKAPTPEHVFEKCVSVSSEAEAINHPAALLTVQ